MAVVGLRYKSSVGFHISWIHLALAGDRDRAAKDKMVAATNSWALSDEQQELLIKSCFEGVVGGYISLFFSDS